jgi:hypothetical protein
MAACSRMWEETEMLMFIITTAINHFYKGEAHSSETEALL